MAEGSADNRTPVEQQGERYLTFYLGEDVYALPVAMIHEVMRRPPTVSVPQSPPCLEGLANLRGSVLPVANLRRLTGLEPRPASDDNRVVVIHQAGPVGLLVDRLSGLITARPSQIEAIDDAEDKTATETTHTAIRLDHGRGHARIVPAGALLAKAFGRMERPTPGRAVRTSGAAASVSADHRQEKVTLIGCEAAGQHYALPLERVREVLPLPDTVTTVPRSHGAALGVITVRERLLPLVSLRALLGLSPETRRGGRILVVTLGGAQVGLVADRMGAILRVEKNRFDPVPATLGRGSGEAEIQSICRLDGGHLVSVLSPERLFRAGIVEQAMADSGQVKDATVVMEKGTNGEQFVVFRLGADEFGLPIDAVDEVMRVPETLTHLPKSPDFVEGIVNLRGAVIPVIDQRRRFDLPAAPRNRRQRIIVVRVNGMRAGFIVDVISGILTVGQKEITSAESLSIGSHAIFSRVANLQDSDRMVLLIDPEALLDQTEQRLLARLKGEKRSSRNHD